MSVVLSTTWPSIVVVIVEPEVTVSTSWRSPPLQTARPLTAVGANA